VKNERVQIRSVGPYDRTCLGIHSNPGKELRVVEWLEHSHKRHSLLHVDLAFHTVVESEPKAIGPRLGHADDIREHLYSRGAIAFKGALSRARSQFSPSSSRY
jgi:hypothetical protein